MSAGPALSAPAEQRLRVQVVMFDGVEELDWAAPFEVFSGAARMGGHMLEYEPRGTVWQP